MIPSFFRGLIALVVRSGSGVALFLEREAGYQLISLGLIFAGLWIVDPAKRAELAHDLVSFGLGVLARSMGAKRNGTVQTSANG